MILRILFILLISSIVYADASVAHEYIIFVDSLPKVALNKADLYIGKTDITKAGGQPCFVTRVLQPDTTKYLVVIVTTMTQANNTLLNNSNVKKIMYLRSKRYLNSVGQDTLEVIRDYPPDFRWGKVYP